MSFIDTLRGRKKRSEAVTTDTGTVGASDVLLQAILGTEAVSKDMAMQIPAFAACVNLICGVCSMIPIRLYRRKGESVEPEKDPRVALVNDDTRDTLTGTDFKRAMVYDYLTGKGGYAYINHRGKHWYSLNYVEEEQVGFNANTDPIFKDYRILVNGNQYEGYNFIKLLRRTKNGYMGTTIIRENAQALSEAYNMVLFSTTEIKKGGMKRGFLQSEKRLSQQAVNELQSAYRKLYSNGSNSESAVVLNDGLKFQDAGQTSVEMQLVDLRTQQAKDICRIFGVPSAILLGGASEQDWKSFIQYSIAPIMETFEEALNRDFLLEKEKGSLFWAYDMSELTKADIKTRYEAYDIALKSGWMQMDEVRKQENRASLDIPFVKLNLSDVLYDPKTKVIFTPNTGTKGTISDAPTAGEPDTKPDPQGEGGQDPPKDPEKEPDGKDPEQEGNENENQTQD